MAQLTIPNTFKGGEIIDASKEQQNFSAVVESLSDGTKDVSFNTTVISTDLNTTRLTITGDCTTNGEPNGERVFFPLVRNNGNSGIYDPSIIPNRAQDYQGVFTSSGSGAGTPGFVMPRSGVVVGIAARYVGASGHFQWKISGGNASSPTMIGADVTTNITFSPSSQTSFPAGTIISARKDVSEFPVPTETGCEDSLMIEVKFT